MNNELEDEKEHLHLLYIRQYGSYMIVTMVIQHKNYI